ncbi:unnamed protein product [Cylindrotheca closterium]|uniref:Uncharacterized protein n=1 Tax=Cylindrotheca closterium TaxID=2856 RepID=A0AAD2PW98_9STRA|nr:unnamed protein product [Cylindrotheca closterium]
MSNVSLFKAYGDGEPPPYYSFNPKYTSDEKFGQGRIKSACSEVKNNSLKLTGNAEKDPLAGLHCMGILDLVNHDNIKDVIMVVPFQGTKKLREKIEALTSSCSTMNRLKYVKQKVLVVTGAKVEPVNRRVIKDPDGVKMYFSFG